MPGVPPLYYVRSSNKTDSLSVHTQIIDPLDRYRWIVRYHIYHVEYQCHVFVSFSRLNLNRHTLTIRVEFWLEA